MLISSWPHHTKACAAQSLLYNNLRWSNPMSLTNTRSRALTSYPAFLYSCHAGSSCTLCTHVCNQACTSAANIPHVQIHVTLANLLGKLLCRRQQPASKATTSIRVPYRHVAQIRAVLQCGHAVVVLVVHRSDCE